MTEESIFAEALQKATAEEMRAYLDEACGNDAELRAGVECLLRASSDAGSFVDRPPAGLAATVNVDPQDGTPQSGGGSKVISLPELEPCATPGRIGKLGPYEIIEVVGQGGF